jgi:hypothetical protein
MAKTIVAGLGPGHSMTIDSLSPWIWSGLLVGFFAAVTIAYLWHVNRCLLRVPKEVQELSGPRWTPEELRKKYKELENNPIDYTSKLPPKQDRRYIVTGGNGEPTDPYLSWDVS